MKDLPDLCIGYGVSDEFRYAPPSSVYVKLFHLLNR
jgi:hypothetical protein